MRRALSVAAAIALAGCATSSEAEKHQAMGQIRDCYYAKAEQLDDGSSDARTVAAGIATACGSQIERAISVITKGEDLYFIRSFEPEFRRQAQSQATVVVLDRRARSRR